MDRWSYHTASNNAATHIFNQAANGCDSVVSLDLTINYSIQTTDSLVACDSAEWNGTTYYTSGIYVDTLQTTLSCDSIVTMDMTINYSIATNDSLVACDSAVWNGKCIYDNRYLCRHTTND